MKVKLNYKGKEIVAEIADEELEKLVAEPKKKTGWEPVIGHGTQFYIDENGLIKSQTCEGNSFFVNSPDSRDKVSNNFNSEELAKNIARAEVLHRNMLRRSIKICDKVDWNNPFRSKYYIAYNYDAKEIRTDWLISARDFSQIYFDTEEHARQVAEEFRNELIWYFTEFKERMD